MGRRPNPDVFLPPEVAMFGNAFARRWQASATNLRTYATWWQLFYTAAVSRFEWEGLPKEVDVRYMEACLFSRGSVALTRRTAQKTNLVPYVVAPFASEGKLDCYNNPNKIRLLTANGQQFTRHANWHVRRSGNQHGTTARLLPADAAVCWDSQTRLPLFSVIDLACRRLAEIDVTIDQHVRANRVPFVFSVSEEGKANAEDMWNRIDSGQPAIYINPLGSSVVQATVLSTGVGYVADKLLNDELKIVAQTYTALGIDNNAAAEKKERVQTAETVANNEQFMLQRRSALKAREQFCERLREVFALDVSVRWAVPHTWEDGSNDEPYRDSAGGLASPSYKVHEPLFPASNGGSASDNAI